MSRKYDNSRDVPTDTLVKRLDELSDAIAGGRDSQDREFTMRIPAECDRDADLVLAESSRRLGAEDTELAAAKARLAELESSLTKQAAAAKQGMDAAKAESGEQLRIAKQIRAESSPEMLESERQANALLTDRIAALEKALERTVDQAERCLNEACCAAVEKLTELAPHMGWDPGEKSAELHMRRVRSAALLKEKE